MMEFEYTDEQGNDFTYEASSKEVDEVAKEIGYENIVDTLIMDYKVDKKKLDEYTIRKVIEMLIDDAWIEPTDLAGEEQIKEALYETAIKHDEACKIQREEDDASWRLRCRI